MRVRKCHWLVSGSSCVLMAVLGGQALAQSASEEANLDGAVAENEAAASEAESRNSDVARMSEVIVTAQKRSERLQDVPMSITAATDEELKARGITTTDDLVKLVPGFSFQKSNYGLPIYYIRGVGFNETTLGVSPAVTIYTDQIPLPYAPMTRGAILDLERMEVLKGPQGTLFGQNSTGGAINYIAAKPTSSFESGFDVTVGRFSQVDVEGFISGPLTDTLSARVAVRTENQGDWQEGYTNGDTIGEESFINGRLILDWAPSDGVDLSFMASAWRDTSDTQQPQRMFFDAGQPAPRGRPLTFPTDVFPEAPLDARAAAWDLDGDFARDDRFQQFALTGEFDMGSGLTLASLSSYSHYETDLPQDLDGTTYPATVTTDTGTIKSFSQELRLSGSYGERVRWMIGGNYQDDSVDERFIFDPSLTTGTHLRVGPTDFTFDRYYIDNVQDVVTKAVFGSLDFDLSDSVTLQGAVRYTGQERDFEGCTRDFGDGELVAGYSALASALAGEMITIPPGACATLDANNRPLDLATSSLDEDNLSWRVSLNWKPSNDTLLYANVTKGYKAGSFPTLPSLNVLQLQGIEQESVLGYEAGVKSSFADRRVSLDGAVFYYDYKDKQLLGYLAVPPFGTLPSLVSIPDSRIQGAEVNLALFPVEGLRVNINGAYIDTEVQSDPTNPTGPFGTPGTFVGQDFPFTPEWQGVIDARYEFPITPELNMFFGGALTSRSETNTTLLSGDVTAVDRESSMQIDGYTLLDLRAGVETQSGDIRFEIWGRNVTDEFYANNVTRVSDYVFRFTGMPVTYGATLRYRF